MITIFFFKHCDWLFFLGCVWGRKSLSWTMICWQAGFLSDPPLACNSHFALASLSPLFARNTQKITPVLQATYLYLPGAIIRDEDRKRAPFLVLGLAPWYGTICLSLEQIAPSPTAHARTLLRGFSRMSRRGNGVQNPEIVYAFGPQLNAFMAVRSLLKYFRPKLFQFEWRQCRI